MVTLPISVLSSHVFLLVIYVAENIGNRGQIQIFRPNVPPENTEINGGEGFGEYIFGVA